ncbi:MAG TPA: tetratricopeptide repeat protein [Kofleriaceae bacterium]|nr:tetratricopeptide repeat protein [Kofleriaceae bacterium]
MLRYNPLVFGRAGALVIAFAVAGGCGHPSSGEHGTGSNATAAKLAEVADATPVELPALTFGLGSLDGFAYRTRPGHDLFKQARDTSLKGDWAGAATLCEAALKADPDHLDASYLLAVARAKQNQLEGILPPLTKAVSADFGKWGQASLDQPALQKFLGTPSGQAWRARVEKDRDAFAASLARSLVVTSHGDLYAFDAQASRWLRLSRTGGAVVGAFMPPGVARIVYVTREKERTASGAGAGSAAAKPTGKGKGKTKVKLGMIDLTTGRARLAVDLAGTGSVRVAYNAKKLKRFVVRVGNAWSSVVDEIKLRLEPEAKGTHIGYLADLAGTTWLDVTGRRAQLTRIGVPNVSADWDTQSLASALRIGSSHRVVTVPSPGLIEGNTLVWSPDKTQLAFAAKLADTCKPNEPTAAAFVADGSTGAVQELERATGGIAVEWVAERKLAVAGDHGVTVVDLAGGAPLPLPGADGLLVPRKKPTCTPEPEDEEPIEEEPSDSEAVH